MNDSALAERLAHTVKGVAGNLGIVKVREAAAKVESAVCAGDSGVPALLNDLQAVLASQVGAIQTAIAAVEPARSQSGGRVRRAFDAGAAGKALTRLKELPERNDGDAGDAVQSVVEIFSGAVDAERLNALSADVDQFDFDGALAKLAEIARECSVEDGGTVQRFSPDATSL